MGEKKLEAGEFAYREGDTADVVYIIASGKMELLEANDGREAQIQVIEAGNAFGELAIFDAQSLRTQSARALEPSVLTTITAAEFEAQVAQCPKPILPLLHLVFEKMKAAKVKRQASLVAAVLDSDVKTVKIAPADEKLKSQFKPMEVGLNRLPFRIGGYPESGEASRRDQLHLAIASQENPLRVSRQHCEITIENNALVVSDLGSRFCTTVNGTTVGRGRGNYMAPLKKGENQVILGAVDGPYKITVTCT